MNLHELKAKIDQLIEQGKGELPVLNKADEGMIYTDVEIHSITPNQAPFEGLQLEQDYINAPKGDHILIDFKA